MHTIKPTLSIGMHDVKYLCLYVQGQRNLNQQIITDVEVNCLAGVLFTSGILLFYTAMVVPIQILVWDYSDACVMFPTLYFDVFVDLFFIVRICCCKCF